MTIIAKIVALLYIIGAISVTTAAFLSSNVHGFLCLGIAFFIPCIVLYLEASKGGGK